MQNRIAIVAVALGCILLGVLFQLIRKNRLQEKYSLLWIASALVMLLLSLWRNLLESFAAWVGVYYAPSALFIAAMFCGLVIALHYSVVLSTLTAQNKTLAQEVALLREEIDRLKKPPGGGRKARRTEPVRRRS